MKTNFIILLLAVAATILAHGGELTPPSRFQIIPVTYDVDNGKGGLQLRRAVIKMDSETGETWILTSEIKNDSIVEGWAVLTDTLTAIIAEDYARKFPKKPPGK